MNKKMLTTYGLKWNPFLPDQPCEALFNPARVKHFCWRIEQLAQDGGFALVSGEPGMGKSVAMRMLADRLSALPEVTVGVLTHPQSSVGDFYRELGHLFGVSLSSCNRWGGFKALRERWKAHIDSTLYRPVLLIDEAQLVQTPVFAELRILSSMDFDSRNVLTVVLCGDQRLTERLNGPELKPLESRIRARLLMDHTSNQDIIDLLKHGIREAGNPRLMTAGLMGTIAEQSMGNLRAAMRISNDVLDAALENGCKQLDEKLFLEIFGKLETRGSKKSTRGKRA